MKYSSLYTRDSLGNVRVWYMEQEGDKYRTTSGLLDGEKVTSEWTVAKPKNVGKRNETTGEQQAAAEIEARYKKQKKTGYFEDVKDIDKAQYVEPMLAKSYKDYAEKIDFKSQQWGMQTKYNGICCIATKDGCFSRKGEKFLSVDHIRNCLAPFFEKHPKSFIHGELFNDAYRDRLNEIVKLCRKTVNITKEDIAKSKSLISFYVYDGCIVEAGLDQSSPYFKRKEWIDENLISNYNCCVEVKTEIIRDKDHLDSFFKEKITRGDEGLILRNMNMIYEHKRSGNLLKYKPIDSDEMMILNVTEGSGNWKDKAKNITVRTKEGLIFDAVFKGDMKSAEDFLKNADKWIGKEVTVQFFGRTGLGCPQYAQIDINNCFRAD
ncbi:hypothetical protein EBT16_06290 [bacterium]|nr:hypothetical protein [bacterium]